MPYLVECTLLLICAIAAFTDWRQGTIPNWLTLPVLIAAPIYAGYAEWPWGLYRSLLGIVICGLVPVLLFWRQAIGGGDVKLLAAVGAVAGYMLGLEIQLYAFVFAAFFALLRLTWDGKLWRTLVNCMYVAFNPFLPKARRRVIPTEAMTSMRFGGAIFAAALLSITVRTLSL